MVFFRLGCDTVESSRKMVEHEEDFFSGPPGPPPKRPPPPPPDSTIDRDCARCIWLRLRTIPSEKDWMIGMAFFRFSSDFKTLFDAGILHAPKSVDEVNEKTPAKLLTLKSRFGD